MVIFYFYWLQRYRANSIPVLYRLFIAAVRVFDNNVTKKLFTKVRIQIKIAVHLYKITIAGEAKQAHRRINYLLLYHPGITNGHVLLVYLQRIQQLHLLFFQYSKLHTVYPPAIFNNINVAAEGGFELAFRNYEYMINH